MAHRVLLADDHRILLDGLRTLLGARKDLEIVRAATNGSQVLRALHGDRIDLAVIDVAMPEVDGLEVVARAREARLPTRFIFLTMYDDPSYLKRAEELGVEGYVLKEGASDELMAAIDAVLAGTTFLSRRLGVAKRAVAQLPVGLGTLTAAERTVLRELALGKTSREIAEVLHISYRTVQNHRANICIKLDLSGTNRLLQFAVENRERL